MFDGDRLNLNSKNYLFIPLLGFFLLLKKFKNV